MSDVLDAFEAEFDGETLPISFSVEHKNDDIDQELENTDDEAEKPARRNNGEQWNDDPVKLYLTQMGKIPLLKRAEEIALAKRIEESRARFRAEILQCDAVLGRACSVLHRAEKGELRFDRTMRISVTENLERNQILDRLAPNLHTVDALRKRNAHDYQTAMAVSRPSDDRIEAWKRLGRSKQHGATLIEELGLRTNRLQPLFKELEEISC
ncbi:MAG: sigma-70 factor domain-containing protein, partial [Candidatus Peribacteraceae bacterium]